MTALAEEITFDPAINMARQSLYRFAALSLLDPKAGSWHRLYMLRNDPLLVQAAALIRNLPEAVPDELGLGERPLDQLDPKRVLKQLPDSPVTFNAEYETTFGLVVSAACPPYETEYIDSKFAFQRSNTLADISGFYRAFGLITSDEHPERPDHIVQELEFMAFLLGHQRRIANADPRARRQRIEVCHNAQTQFLREHLAWWAPALANLLTRADQECFYRSAAVFLSALIPAERALLRVGIPERLAIPSQFERPEACEGCELASF